MSQKQIVTGKGVIGQLHSVALAAISGPRVVCDPQRFATAIAARAVTEDDIERQRPVANAAKRRNHSDARLGRGVIV